MPKHSYLNEMAFTGVDPNIPSADPNCCGEFDNIHTAHPPPGGNTIEIPGCRFSKFDCAHMHWRWSNLVLPGQKVDVMVEPSDDSTIKEELRGQPYLVSKHPLPTAAHLLDRQKIEIVIVKAHPGVAAEDNPDNPFISLINVPPEILATQMKFSGTPGGTPSPLSFGKQVLTADHPILWYEATSRQPFTDVFFRHGTYVIDRSHSCPEGTVPNIDCSGNMFPGPCVSLNTCAVK